jgi:histidyl-tRNA synthetase
VPPQHSACCGGAAIAGTGFAIGVERLALAVMAQGTVATDAPQVAMVPLGESGALFAIKIAQRMRARELQVELLSPDRGLKALMRRAARSGARFAVIIGDNEVAQRKVQVRDLKASTQREAPIDSDAEIDGLIEEVRRSFV